MIEWLTTPGSLRPSRFAPLVFRTDAPEGLVVVAEIAGGRAEESVYRPTEADPAVGAFTYKYGGSETSVVGDWTVFTVRRREGWPSDVNLIPLERDVSALEDAIAALQADVTTLQADVVTAQETADNAASAASAAQSTANTHAPRHIAGAADEVDGDKLDIDRTGSNYTPATDGALSSETYHLTSHLKGIDTALGLRATTTSFNDHKARHIRGGADELDADLLDIDFSPTNYTSTSGSNGTTSTQELTSHLKGIDDALLVAKTTTYSGFLLTGAGTASTTFCLLPIGEATARSLANIAQAQIVWGRAGTFKNFRARQLQATGDADAFTMFININGSDTALTVTGMSGTDNSLKSDTTHSATVAVGDLVTITKVNTGATTTSNLVWCFDFVG